MGALTLTPFPAFPRSGKHPNRGRSVFPPLSMCFSSTGEGARIARGWGVFDPRLHSRYTCRMSIQLIQRYHASVEKIIRYGGSRNESALRKPFQDLLEQYARRRRICCWLPKWNCAYANGTARDSRRHVEGHVAAGLGLLGSKDEKDNLADEIAAKLVKGYPTTNILFEDTHTAALYQGGQEVSRADFADAAALDRLCSTRFVSYESEEVRQFHAAIAGFNADVPALAADPPRSSTEQVASNATFDRALERVLWSYVARRSTHTWRWPMSREMLIQHVLDRRYIYDRLRSSRNFTATMPLRTNFKRWSATFYRAGTQRKIHARIAPYYETINARAAQIY